MVCACGRIGFDASTGASGDAGSGTSDSIVTDAPIYFLDAGECPPTYTVEGGSCYRFVTSSVTWLVAEASCEADAVGAHLAIIADTSEAALIDSVWNSAAWIGGTDRLGEGTYVDVTDAPWTFFDWDAGDPDGDSEDCFSVDSTAELEDVPCSEAREFLCEFDGRPAVPSSYQ